MKKELTKAEKEAFIISKGWQTWWNDNNWIHTTIMAGANLDMCGVSLDQAYRIATKK